MTYFYSAADTDTELLARGGSQVFTFILTLPPAFSLFELFALPFTQLCQMFYYRSRGENPFRRENGVCHGDYLMYLFNMDFPGFPKTVETPEQEAMQDRLLDILKSFMVSGRPEMKDKLAGPWTPVQKNAVKFKVSLYFMLKYSYFTGTISVHGAGSFPCDEGERRGIMDTFKVLEGD